MDQDLLIKKGVKPTHVRKAILNNYSLKIGSRASLVACKNEISYGMVMRIETDQLNELYSEASVADYNAEDVFVCTEDNIMIKTRCYNLPIEKLRGTNSEYAEKLIVLAKKLDFPEAYLEKIKNL